MIVLTREEAETVLGPSPIQPDSALEPVPLKDGTYVLPEDVLDDPANADVAAFLTDHIVPGDPDQELIFGEEEGDAYQAAALTWSEGGAQRAARAG